MNIYPLHLVIALPHLAHPQARDPKSHRSGSRLERRLRKAALKGKPIVLGSRDQPYEPPAKGPSPLEVLRPFDGLEVSITVGSSGILRELALLAELDQRHAVTVDVVIADLGSEALHKSLQTVRGLAEPGLTTRLLIDELNVPERRLRQLFKAARHCRACDILAVPGTIHFQRVRMVCGFPRPQPGRC